MVKHMQMRKLGIWIGTIVIAAAALGGCDLLTSPETRVERARDHIDAGENRAAIIELRKVLESEPANAGARLMLAEAEYASGDIGAAEADLNRALEAGTPAADAARLKARLQLAFGRNQVLLTQLETGEIAIPEPDRSVFRGRALLGLRQPVDARRAFEEALAAAPDSMDARLGLIETTAATGAVSTALEDLDRVVAADPAAARAQVLRGSLLLQVGRPKEADAALSQALEHARGRLDEMAQAQAMAGQVDARLANADVQGAETAMAELERRAGSAPIARLLKARLMIAKGDLPSAIATLTALTNDLPEFLPSRFLLGSALLAQGNLYQAERHLALVMQAVPENLEARKRLAEIRLRMNRPESAIELLSSSGREGLSDPQAIALLGAAQLSAGADPSAIQRLEQAIERQPGNRDARLDLAGLYIGAGNASRAVELLRSTPVSQDDARREYLLIRALAATSGEQSARAEITRMMGAHPGDPERLNLAAGFLLSFGDKPAATRALEQALTAKPDHVPTLINLSRSRVDAGRAEDAEALLRRALSHDPSSVEARIALAEMAGRRGDTDEARRLLEEIRVDDARAVASKLLLARLYLSGRESAKASKVLAEAIAAAPNRSDALAAAGRLQSDFGQHEQALGYFRKAADLEPQVAAHWVNLARAQGALDYGPAARESLERALKLEPDSVDVVAFAAKLDIAQKRGEQGLARVVELRRRLPRDAGAALLEGDTRSSLGQYAQAASAYAESRRLQPSAAAAVREAQARQLAGQADADAPLREWLRQHPDDLPARAMHAVVLDQGGQADLAIKEYERFLATGQRDPVMLNNLAWRYFEKGDPRAEALARDARRLAPTNGAIADTLGWILVRKGAHDEGIRLLREAASLAPDEPEIQLHLAEALVTAGEAVEARQLLGKLLEGKREFAARDRAQELLRKAGG